MDKIKIYEIAKKLDLTSKEVVEVAKKLNIDVKSHLSSVDEDVAKKIEDSIKNVNANNKTKNIKQENGLKQEDKKSNKKEEIKAKKTSDGKKDKSETPVIIRREVINTDVNTKQSQVKKQEDKKETMGFVERKKNADFNIVYRNKQTKPMTVSELFGLNKGKQEENKTDVEEKQKVKQEARQEIKQEEKENIQAVEEKNNRDVENKSSREEQTKIMKNNYENQGYNKQNRNFQKDGQNRFNRDNQEKFNRDNHDKYNMQNRDGFTRNNRNEQGGFKYNRDGQNRYNRDNQNGYNRQNRNDQNGNNRFNKDNRGFGNNQRFGTKKPLDEKGIEKNIKNIMSVESVEKEVVREYNKAIDKQKENSKFDENRTTKKNQKSRKNNNSEINEHKLKGLKRTNSLSNMFDDQDGEMLDYYDLTTQRGKKGKKKQSAKDEERTKQKIFKLTEITIPETITVKDLAQELKKNAAEIIKKLLGYGMMATLNNEIDFDTAALISEEFGVTAIKKETITEEDILFDESEDSEDKLMPRPPVVVVMGHVDHGKTSLLDTIRKTNVIEGEAGGITQAIGAYKVKINDREITFLDTPGHEAFTAMRARGAQITDIAILVVAANDGVMPQTIEAINHAKSAGIPIIVAVNKIDLPDANVDKVKQELMAYDLVSEEWGGDTIFVPISAKKHINIEQLLEMVLLVADMKELKSNPNKQAKGVVIEARLDKSKGAIATMLVQRGTLDVGDTIVVGASIGRIRSMVDDKGKKVKKAGPSTPVEIMGLTEVPEAGDTFYEVDDEKMAKHLIERRKRQAREKAINATSRVTLNDLFNQISKGDLKTLNLIVKADVQGSVEAVKQALEKLSNEEVAVKVIHSAAGAVNESDVTLAKVSNAIIIAFNVRPVSGARDMADKDEVEIKQYSVIYQAIEDVESAMKGMLAPKFEEKVIGTAEVRQTFKISNVGTIAGAYVTDGKLERNAGVRVLRDNVVIHEGKLASLKRFKDDTKEVAKGYECGIQIEKYNDIQEGDIIEAFILEEVKR